MLKMSCKSIFCILILLFANLISQTRVFADNAQKMRVSVAGIKNQKGEKLILTKKSTVLLRGHTLADQDVSMVLNKSKKHKEKVRSNKNGRFRMKIKLYEGVNFIKLKMKNKISKKVNLTIVSTPLNFSRPFDGSPTKNNSPFVRLIPDSKSYDPGSKIRTEAAAISNDMAEDESSAKRSDKISLGLVFFGQFVDHDLDANLANAQGPSFSPQNPINVRTPALDLDSVYGLGPDLQPEFYTEDKLFFRLAASGNDLLRDEEGVAIIGDGRNDENGFVSTIHLSFQKYHNFLMNQALKGIDSKSLNSEIKTALFSQVRNNVIRHYQGIVTNQMSVAFSGLPVPANMPSIENVPVEFAGAVYRLGHTLVPQEIIVDDLGTKRSPVDSDLRRPGALIRLDLLFGDKAQMAAGFDDKVAQTMRELLIPLSPTNPALGHMVGSHAPNIGVGKVINGVLHLDLVETNILRGREQKIPSGEEYAAHMLGITYNSQKHGNTDLWVYILEEANNFGYLGKVGGEIFYKTIGGLINSDPYRYTNTQLFSDQQIEESKNATVEQMLKEIGAL